ncbi:DUF6527 family protein [Phenylobacterium sp.]|uniref:DUF6527 family protein n=1 Tax=Phenylobacterium sp. TaxID=1871053 RepID=UPI00351E0BB6
MTDRAYLDRPKADGTFRACIFPCQHPNVLAQLAVGRLTERPECQVSVDPAFTDGPVWRVTGPADAPTLSPSINCMNDTCWHGFIVDGQVQNPARPAE